MKTKRTTGIERLVRVIEGQLKRLDRLRRVSDSVQDNMNTLASVDSSFDELCGLFQRYSSMPVRVILATRMYMMAKTTAQEQVFMKLAKKYRFQFEIDSSKADKKKKRRGGSCSLPLPGGVLEQNRNVTL